MSRVDPLAYGGETAQGPWVPHSSHVFRETGVFCTVMGWTRPHGDAPDSPGQTCDGCHLTPDDFRTSAVCDPKHPSLPKTLLTEQWDAYKARIMP